MLLQKDIRAEAFLGVQGPVPVVFDTIDSNGSVVLHVPFPKPPQSKWDFFLAVYYSLINFP